MILTIPVFAVLLVGAFDLIIGGVILSQSPRNPINVTFWIFATTGALWAIPFAFFLSLSDPVWLDFLGRLLYFGGACIPAAFYYFSRTFSTAEFPSRAESAIVFVSIAIIGILYFCTPFLIETYYIDGGGVRVLVFGPLHLLFDAMFWTYFGFALALFYRVYKSADKHIRSQVLLIMFGTYATLAAAAVVNMFGPSFFGVFQYDWIGPVAMIVWVCTVAYAVARYQLFNVRVIAAELFVVTLWLFLLARMVLSQTNYDFWINALSFSVIFVLGLFIIRGVIQEVIQRELIQAQEKELEKANRQQESLLHFISHEVKGYLTKNEAAFAAISTGDFGAVSEPLKHMSEAALTDTRKGVDTVMDILDASNLKKGTVSFTKKRFDLATMVSDIVSDLTRAAEAKKLSLTYDAPKTPFMTEGDEDKIRRHVVRNVLDNSIKYTPSGSIRVSLAKDGRVARLTIEDTGVGITPEDMRRLFTEGGHGAESIKVNVDSTGYGLFIAKQIVEAHGGKIRAESEGKGKGSKFTVEFPLSA
jgi:signal transduction histidine kinase